jgi:hypothetical protein
MAWAEVSGGTLMSFDLRIALIPDEPAVDTAERFRREAVRTARAFLSEQESNNAPRP